MIAASLWLIPADFETLAKRFDNLAEYSVWQLLNTAKRRKWVYQRGNVYFTYKKTVTDILNPEGYDLDLKEEVKSEFRQAFENFQKLYTPH